MAKDKRERLGKAEFREFAAKVAAELGMHLDPGWDEDMWNARITDGDIGYSLSEDYRTPGRVEVSGQFPNSNWWYEKGARKSIGVAMDRGPAVVAAEIRRRLEPVYRGALARVREGIERENADTERRLDWAADVKATVGEERVSMPGHCQSEGRTELVVSGDGLMGGWLKTYGSGADVEFERFRVPAEVAVRMLWVFKQLVPARDRDDLR